MDDNTTLVILAILFITYGLVTNWIESRERIKIAELDDEEKKSI